MDRAEFKDLPKELQDNLFTLLERINRVRHAYGRAMIVTSGYRTPAINEATANSGKASNHLKCAAVDIQDKDGKLWAWCEKNLQFLKDNNLWLEDKRWTPTWVHFQIYPPKSGKRIFIPSNKPAPAPKAWSGTYDKKFD